MTTLRWIPLVLALAVLGCESQTNQVLVLPSPASTATVAATQTASAAGAVVTVTQPGQLPASVQSADRLQVAVGGTLLPVQKAPDGTITFAVPQATPLDKDAAGNLHVLFVVNERESVPVTLATGGPVTFGQPAVTTEPANGAIAQGMGVRLTANTPADPARYQFAWSYGTTPQGPFQGIPGDGKTVEWTPPAAGNYMIRVEAIDMATHQSASAVTPQAAVLVSTAEDVITTDPATGFVTLGAPVTLSFNRPAALTGTDLHYAWSQGASPQGPWTPIALDAPSVPWTPGAAGNYYVKVDVSDAATGKVSTFVSPTAQVVVGGGASVVTPSARSVERGDAVDLTVNAPGSGAVNWYVAPAGGSALTSSYTRIQGATSRTIHWVATDAGAFNFRVDVPQADGTVTTFTTSQPVLNVVETTPVIQSVPPNTIVAPGSAVTLQLNARGLDEGRYQFIFSVSTNPSFGWTTLPLDSDDELTSKTREWETATPGAFSAGTTPGAYYVKVDAAEVGGTRAYTFVSSTPVVTVQP